VSDIRGVAALRMGVFDKINYKSFWIALAIPQPQSQKYAKIHPKEFTFGSTTL
tara:strand:+ start:93 stop:251 length:159 start_codon:yes stop_codon:yes gene_type:complete